MKLSGSVVPSLSLFSFELCFLLSCLCRNPSPWVPTSDQDQEDLEPVAMRKAITNGALLHRQMERKVPREWILDSKCDWQLSQPRELTIEPNIGVQQLEPFQFSISGVVY